MLLTILYWVILVLAIIGAFTPPSWAYGRYVSNLTIIALFVIIGLKTFKTPLQ
jgi:hypothetical protein